MFTNRKQVDEHVHKILSKLPLGPERDIKGFSIARLYTKIHEYGKAIDYLIPYLKINEEASVHALLAKCYRLLAKPDNAKALEHYQRSVQLFPKQPEVIKDACELLCKNTALCTAERAAYWLEQSSTVDDLKDSEGLFTLRLRAEGKIDGAEQENSIEMLIHKELLQRPHDMKLHVRLLRHLLETKRYDEAFNYAHKVEFAKPAQCEASDWYDVVWKALQRREQSKESARDWSYWQLMLLTLDRLIQLSLQSEATSSLSESIGQLFKLDQSIHKFSLLVEQLTANDSREFHQCCLDHYAGQLLLHAASLLFKRELLGKKNKWSQTVRSALPLLLLGYQVNAQHKDKDAYWQRHCSAEQLKLLQLWRCQSAFRCAQLGRTLYGCLQKPQDAELWKEKHQQQQATPGLWSGIDELLAAARQYCADNQWRSQLYQQLYTHAEHKLKESTSFLVRNQRLQQPLYECPSIAEIEGYEHEALLLEPHTLELHVYLALCGDNLAEAPRVRFLKNLRHECKLGLTYCGIDSLCQVDVEVFLYFVVLQAQRKLQVLHETYASLHAGNVKATARPHMLPYANLMGRDELVTPEQCNWWSIVQRLQLNSQLSEASNRMEQREKLKRGIEALRGVAGPQAEIIAVFQVAKLLASRADTNKMDARIEALNKLGINMMRRHSHQQLEPFYRYFKYEQIQASDIWLQTQQLAEDAVSYLSSRLFNNGLYEEFLTEIRGLQLPTAIYLQAEAYRQMADSNRASRISRQNFQERRGECLRQATQLLANQADHPLQAVVQRELKSLMVGDESFTSNDRHNNSSTYEDAEDDYYAAAAVTLNRSKRHEQQLQQQQLQLQQQSFNNELDQAVKQMSKQLCVLKEDVGVGIDGLRQDIKGLTDKLSSIEELLKKLKIGSTASRDTPTRDVDAAAALGLEEFFNMEDAQQTNFMNDRFYSPAAAAIPPNPLFNQNQMYNYYASQAQFMRNPQAPNFYGQRGAGNYNMPPNMFPNAGAAPFMDGLNYGMTVPPPSLVMPQVSQPQPPIMSINQPPAQSNLQLNPGSNFFNGSPFVPSPIQTTPAPVVPQVPPQLPAAIQQTPLVTHKPITVPPPAVVAAPAPAAIAAPIVAPPIVPPTAVAPPPAIFNRALNNQPVEKEPPANVVITSSDPLPKPAVAAAQPTLSVTIPAQHIKPSLVQPAEPPQPVLASNDFKFSLNNNSKVANDTTSIFKGFGTTSSNSTFSFKTQVAQAAAEKQKELAAEAAAAASTSVHNESDHNQSAGQDASAELDYDPRPDFQGIIPLPDEVEVRTGEEDEVVSFSHRAKLFRHVDHEWKERGIGEIKILKNQATGSTRILMRREQTHKICANHKITATMQLTTPEQDKEGKSFLWGANDFADEKLQLEKFLVRFKLPETAQRFKTAFEEAAKDAKTAEAKLTVPAKPSLGFVTSTPAPNMQQKSIDPPKSIVAGTNNNNDAAASLVSKSLFWQFDHWLLDSSSSSTTTTTSSKVTTAPFANFSFGGIGNAAKPNLSFGSLQAPDTSTNTSNAGYTTAFNFGSNLSSSNIADSTLQSQTAAVKAAEAEAEAVEEYVPTAHFEPVIPLPELVKVVTGEENEVVLFEYRAKLLRFDKENNEWKERGLGVMKVLQQKDDPTQVRLLMRREQIFKLCCNQRLLPTTVFTYAKNSETSLTWAGQDFADEELSLEMLCVRFKTAATCKQFYDTVLKAQAAMSQNSKEVTQPENNKDKPAEKPVTKGFGDAFKPKAGSWTCEGCYTNNTATQLYCLACEAPKDATVPPKAATLDQSGALNLSSSAGKFSFGFPAAAAATTNSSTVGGGGFTFGAPAAEKKVEPPVTNNNAKPAVSFAPVVAPAAGAAPLSNFGDLFKPKAGSWSCKDCYTNNDGGQLYCLACQAPKDDTVPKKENTLDTSGGITFPAPTTKFSFGFGAPAAAATPAPVVAPTTAPIVAPTPAIGSETFNFKINETKEKGDAPIFGSSSFNFNASTTPAASLTSNTFSFSMPKAQSVQPKSPGGGAGDDDDSHVEEEENGAYFAPVIPLPDKIDVKTGEEDEEVLYSQRAKLYRLADNTEWKERGLGLVKILRHKETKNLRVVMRREQVLKLCLNHVLNASVVYKPKDEKSLLFAAFDFSEGESVLERFALRFKTAEIVQAFLSAVKSALDGTAVAQPVDIQSPQQPSSSTSAGISNEIQTLADKLQLNPEFLVAETKCNGCRGCDADKFVWTATVPTENKDVVKSLPLTLPALKLPPPKAQGILAPPNRTLLKASTLEANTTNSNFGSFGGFSTAVSANSTATVGSFSKPEEPPKGGFLFGHSEKSVFGQSLFSGSSNPAKPQGSIFGGSIAAEKSSDSPKVSIFGNPVNPPTAVTGKPDEGVKSIFGSSILTSNNTFGSNTSGSFSFGGLAAKGAATTADTEPKKQETNNKDNTLKEAPSTPNFLEIASRGGVDFASLAAKGGSGSQPIGFQKSETGGFYGLTHQNDFKYFKNPSTSILSQNDGEADSSNTGDTTNDENYDPHYEPIIALPDEIVVSTGEEDENQLFCQRTMLYRYDAANKLWKERGVGEVKILKHKKTNKVRLIMRREQVHKLVLNMPVGASFTIDYMQDSKKSLAYGGLNYAEDEKGELERLANRFKKEEIAGSFLEIIRACIKDAKEDKQSESDGETGNDDTH
ncbi:LOW QUALITY PROTEIN: E3 SUMO-protein ligase RanBP2 [Drosophila sulfurigaster albostrigata]|uniref:LOW QUALITY PROTEIN: E3 SUMO-protein ligase RanBP2 n=1 Tax=Drosophila sulfurigaster albostrigata TaxID=89887 RepID=UPI002D21EBD0|nr:LOW QUALITY PROTEIN: E3 SUMO-protein ligase RanBP2 [Drosophila sulfurigaster albostrigata]